MSIDKASENLAIHAQALALGLERTLNEIAGGKVGFVLILQPFGNSKIQQYVSNMKREDGKDSLEKLLERWEKGRADIPALYNPDLPQEER